jgi:hypothetical protein
MNADERAEIGKLLAPYGLPKHEVDSIPTVEAARERATLERHRLDDASQLQPERCASRPPAEQSWPAALGDAFHGLVGEFVNTISPESEADPAALAIQLLVAYGNCVGRNAHARVNHMVHRCNLFAVLVGETSKGRKGSSWSPVRALFDRVDEAWTRERLVGGGLSSGEGLVWAVRDPIYKMIDGKNTQVDAGVTDKRVLAFEPEFASVLTVMERSGNTLSATARDAWDGSDLRLLTKNNPASATGPHPSMIGHISRAELRRCITNTEKANGFANRILWCAAKRSKLLPEGGNTSDGEMERLAAAARSAVKHARSIGHPLQRTPAARELWAEVYAELTAERDDLLGGVLARGEAQVLRLSLIYAALDCAEHVDVVHLRAALDVWRSCSQSAAWAFGGALRDPVAEKLLALFRSASPRGVTGTEIRDHFNRNLKNGQPQRALESLQRCGLARLEKRVTNGRSADLWFAVIEVVSVVGRSHGEP